MGHKHPNQTTVICYVKSHSFFLQSSIIIHDEAEHPIEEYSTAPDKWMICRDLTEYPIEDSHLDQHQIGHFMILW